MHVFMLILTLAGGPEKTVAICRSYQACSNLGADAAATYVREFHRMPSDVTYRVVSAVVL